MLPLQVYDILAKQETRHFNVPEYERVHFYLLADLLIEQPFNKEGAKHPLLNRQLPLFLISDIVVVTFKFSTPPKPLPPLFIPLLAVEIRRDIKSYVEILDFAILLKISETPCLP